MFAVNVLITGGSQGIGLELAKCFARDGHHVILAARNRDKLLEAEKHIAKSCQAEVTVISVDLSENRSGKKLHDALEEMHCDIDVLINNAGIGFAGRSVDIPWEKEEEMVRLNDMTMMTLSRLYLKDFIERGHGEIINVASTGAFQPGPYIAGYYASKAFVLSYTRAIAREAEPFHIPVYCYCPGPVDTAFYEKSGGRKTIGAISPQKAAQYLYTHHKGSTVIIPGIWNRLALAVPSGIKMKIVGAMKRKSL